MAKHSAIALPIDWWRSSELPLKVSVLFLIFAVVLACVAPYLPLQRYDAMAGPVLSGPSFENPLGTDEFGRDLFSRVIYGARISMLVAAVSVFIGTIIGTALGVIAGYFGGRLDVVIMRFLDGLLAFPSLILAIGVTAITGPGIIGVSVALVVVGVPQVARIVRSSVIVERELDYIAGSRAIGAGNMYIAFRHIIPNVRKDIYVQAVVFFAEAVLTEASLSFLGFGVQVPVPSLGSLLNSAQPLMSIAPWYVLGPAAVLTSIILALNVVADRLGTSSGARG